MISVVLSDHWKTDTDLGGLARSRKVPMDAQMRIILELKLLLLLACDAHGLLRSSSSGCCRRRGCLAGRMILRRVQLSDQLFGLQAFFGVTSASSAPSGCGLESAAATATTLTLSDNCALFALLQLPTTIYLVHIV